jgi:phage gpG-like protein
MAIRGLDKARKDMQERAKLFSAKNPKPYNDVSEIAAKSIEQNFDSGGRPKWPKRKYFYPWPILVKTGDMKRGALATVKTWEHGVRWHIDKIKSTFYGIFHQYGTKKLPVRKFALFQDSEIVKMRDVFRKVFLRK